MTRYFQAAETFSAELADGSHAVVVRGEPLPETHELVQRDLAAASPDRAPLFRPLGPDEPEPAPKTRSSRAKLWRRRRRVTGCGSRSRR